MKVNIQKLKNRFIPFLVAVIVFVSMNFIPVSATDYNFMDYITQITPTADGSAVVIELPLGRTRFDVYPSIGQHETIIADELKFPFQIYEDSGITYDIYLQPNYGNYLLLDNVPDDTEQNIWLQLYSYDLETDVPGSTLEPAWDMTYSNTAGLFFYLNDSYKSVASNGCGFGIYEDYESFERDYYATGILKDTSKLTHEQIDESYCTYSSLRFYNTKFHSHGSVGMKITSYEIVLHIKSLVTEDGEYDELLNEINAELYEQGKKIDKLSEKIEDLSNGTPEQNQQADKFQGDINSAVGDLDSAGDVLSGVEKPDVDMDNIVPNDILAGTAYNSFVDTIKVFWDSGLLSTITVVLGALILISYILFGEKR